ncbi:iron ABC transporter permease [Macrococcus capreoli]|uniref:FecCD family ABC transporter permease n=1 Tax=Macrococcus capreoli TaxID=2982690 RepID=UPI0021D5EFB9|nr:iron ABC transporter permease [Macrococcus sp. TMW 2.2395]MCU7558551.1 iron ABC transporter permease [Macrococcus sp. TMW 2.2395]
MKYVVNLILLLLAIVIALMFGDVWIHPIEILKSFIGGSDDYTMLIIHTLRLPRVLLAVTAGVALGIAGCMLQRITKNELASPDVIGIAQGGVVGSLFFLIVLTSKTEQLLFPIAFQSIASIIGAVAVTFVLYYCALRRTFLKERLILIGICMNIFFQGVIMYLIMSSNKRSAQAQIWITGSVHLAEYYQVIIIVITIILIICIMAYFTRHLDIHQLGFNMSHGLGLSYQIMTVITLICVSILSAVSVSFTGGLQFVGLIAPHIALKMKHHSYIQWCLTSGCVGGVIVLFSDLIGRTLFLPIEIPAGVFTALIGAPFFMYLLFSRRIKKL